MTQLELKTDGGRSRFAVILVRPEHPENIGLTARAMKNTGFSDFRIVGRLTPGEEAFGPAVHSRDILERTRFFPDLASATADLNVVFASTAKPRKNFRALPLKDAVSLMLSYPLPTRIGLIFGNERTGLTSEDLRRSNFRWTIPQAARQPSYNLSAAVLLTLFEVFGRLAENEKRPPVGLRDTPLPQNQQEECVRLILRNLERRRFLQASNRRHATEMVCDLLGRLAITERDRRLLLALFGQAGSDEGGTTS